MSSPNIFEMEFKKGESKPSMKGSSFVVKTISKEQEEKIASLQKESEAYLKNESGPFWLRGLKSLFLYLGLLMFFFLLAYIAYLGSWSAAYKNVGWLFYLSPSFIIVFFVLYYLNRRFVKRLDKSPLKKEINEKINQTEEESNRELGIPPDAVKTDILAEFKRSEKSEEKDLINFSMSVFRHEGSLCFSERSRLVKVPLSSLKNITVLKDRVYFHGWNKLEGPTSFEYAKYDIKADKFGGLSLKPCELVIEDKEKGSFRILFPPYEINVFIRLTHLDIVKE